MDVQMAARSIDGGDRIRRTMLRHIQRRSMATYK